MAPHATPLFGISLCGKKRRNEPRKKEEENEADEESSRSAISSAREFFFTPFARLSIFDSFFRCAKALSKRNSSKGKTRERETKRREEENETFEDNAGNVRREDIL